MAVNARTHLLPCAYYDYIRSQVSDMVDDTALSLHDDRRPGIQSARFIHKIEYGTAAMYQSWPTTSVTAVYAAWWTE